MDTAGLDVSERYDLILEGGAGGIQQKAGDYLYYTTIKEQFVDGAWGLMRVYDRVRHDLQVLPGRTPPSGQVASRSNRWRWSAHRCRRRIRATSARPMRRCVRMRP